MSFIQYLQESVDDESKLVHLKHVGEHAVDSGEEGFKHAFHTLNDVHDAIQGSATSIINSFVKIINHP